MNSWQSPFNVSEISSNIENLINFLDREDVKANFNGNYSYLRLMDALNYIDDLIGLLQPELVPLQTLNELHNYTMNLCNLTNTLFEQSTIDQANNYVDHILRILPQNVEVKLKNRSHFSKSKKLIDVYYHNKAKEIEGVHGNVLSLFEGIKKANQEIVTGEEESPSYLSKIIDADKYVNAYHENIRNFHDDLLVSSDDKLSLKDEILKSKDELQTHIDSIKEDIAEIAVMRKDIDQYYGDLLGEKTGEGEFQGGIKSSIEQIQTNMSELFENQKNEAKTLLDTIESLLPSATSAGLAGAYQERLEAYEKPRQNYIKLFYISITTIVIAAIVPFQIFAGVNDNLINGLVWKIPIFVPLLWMAAFATNRSNEITRLMEEYAHKKVLAQSYEGFKRQINELRKEDTVLMEDLLKSAIESLSYNASASLDKAKREKQLYQKMFDARQKSAENVSLN